MSNWEECVAAGAAYLDDTNPGWWRRINLDRLDLSSTCRCILGQLDGDYLDAVEHRGLAYQGPTPEELGFLAPVHEAHALTDTWRELITARRGGAA